MKGPEEWTIGPGTVMAKMSALSARFPALAEKATYGLRARGPSYLSDRPNDFELLSDCIYCQVYGLHHLRDIRQIIKTDEEGVLTDDLSTRMRYRGTKYRLITRECQNCHQPWEEVLDREYGTWYEIGDA